MRLTRASVASSGKKRARLRVAHDELVESLHDLPAVALGVAAQRGQTLQVVLPQLEERAPALDLPIIQAQTGHVVGGIVALASTKRATITTSLLISLRRLVKVRLANAPAVTPQSLCCSGSGT
jgi:hypothetical protein